MKNIFTTLIIIFFGLIEAYSMDIIDNMGSEKIIISSCETEDTFKIKFSTQNIIVRTMDNEYVHSTWEKAIPNQGLSEQSVEENCKIDVSGMCCSHAVMCALEYCHNRSDLLASYLHKAVTGGYDKGMNLEDAMNFVKNNGVMALPEEQTVKHGSNLPWPKGERYKFTEVINADNFIYDSCIDKAAQYKVILKKYNHPIVISILSGYEGHREISPFLKYRGSDKNDVLGGIVEIEDLVLPKNVKNIYHAVILYGFRDSTKRFFVKNSWGPDKNNGICTLPYDYINKFTRSAFVGLGHENWEGDGIYHAPEEFGLIQQMVKSQASHPLISCSIF